MMATQQKSCIMLQVFNSGAFEKYFCWFGLIKEIFKNMDIRLNKYVLYKLLALTVFGDAKSKYIQALNKYETLF